MKAFKMDRGRHNDQLLILKIRDFQERYPYLKQLPMNFLLWAALKLGIEKMQDVASKSFSRQEFKNQIYGKTGIYR